MSNPYRVIPADILLSGVDTDTLIAIYREAVENHPDMTAAEYRDYFRQKIKEALA
jgi:hypothetical protein